MAGSVHWGAALLPRLTCARTFGGCGSAEQSGDLPPPRRLPPAHHLPLLSLHRRRFFAQRPAASLRPVIFARSCCLHHGTPCPALRPLVRLLTLQSLRSLCRSFSHRCVGLPAPYSLTRSDIHSLGCQVLFLGVQAVGKAFAEAGRQAARSESPPPSCSPHMLLCAHLGLYLRCARCTR